MPDPLSTDTPLSPGNDTLRQMTHYPPDPRAEDMARRLQAAGQNLYNTWFGAAERLGRAATSGTLNTADPLAIQDAFNVAQWATGGKMPFAKPGSLGTGGGKMTLPAAMHYKRQTPGAATLAKQKPLQIQRWGDPDLPMTSVPIEWRQGGGRPQFGIDENGRAFITGAFQPEPTRLQRYIDEYLKPLGDNVYFRSAIRREDYDHLKSGTHRGSINHDTGEPEGGISVAHTPEFPAKYGYFVRGNVIGQGHDGEPLLDLKTATPVSKLMTGGEAQKAFNEARDKRLTELGLSNEQYRALVSGGYIARPQTQQNTEIIYGP